VHFTADELLDGCEAGLVVYGYEGDGTALCASTGSTAYAVYVVFAIMRSIVVDDETYVVDVYAT
jgi:hypothetical protein